MRAQKHIYCDKPLVAAAAEAQEIEAALADYHGVAQMTFQNRFFPATMRAKQLVESGALGEVLEFRAAYLHAGSADAELPVSLEILRPCRRRGDRRPRLARLRLARLAHRPLCRAGRVDADRVRRAARRGRPGPKSPGRRRGLRHAPGADGSPGPSARSRRQRSPPAARTSFAWRFTARGARCASTAWTRTISTGTTPRCRRSRWGGFAAGPASTPAAAILRPPRAFPA